MRFVYSKRRKLTLIKEEPRITKIRQDYLKLRHEYHKIIEENNIAYYKYYLSDNNLDMCIIYLYKVM
jgi:hypothetical protein